MKVRLFIYEYFIVFSQSCSGVLRELFRKQGGFGESFARIPEGSSKKS